VSPALRAFLLDDEPPALRRLARLLEATGRVEIVGRATDPEAGLAQVAALSVDVLFLDIQMPGLSGFEVVERLPAGPMVVFTTAYDRHAVQAFEVNAVDYLLKPIERERLDRTLDRLERLHILAKARKLLLDIRLDRVGQFDIGALERGNLHRIRY